MYIYKITNTVTNKIYIGKTSKTVEERFKGHLYAMSRYKDGLDTTSSRLYASMCKYGPEKFVVSEVEFVNTLSQLNEREMYWITKLNTTNPDIGYNISSGGNGGALFKGHIHSEKTKLLMSKRHRGRISNRLGVVMNPSQKTKISLSLKSYYSDENNLKKHSYSALKSWETRRAKGTTNTTKGLHRYNNGEIEIMDSQCPDGFIEGTLSTNKRLDGYKKMADTNHIRHLNEYKKNINITDFKNDYEIVRMSVKQLMKKYSMTQREILLYIDESNLHRTTYSRQDNSTRCSRPVKNIDTGEIFKSIKEASKVYRGNIGLSCRNFDRTANGYHWRYLDESKT